jgi:hypothetical protein
MKELDSVAALITATAALITAIAAVIPQRKKRKKRK